jgi:hypothetical protein
MRKVCLRWWAPPLLSWRPWWPTARPAGAAAAGDAQHPDRCEIVGGREDNALAFKAAIRSSGAVDNDAVFQVSETSLHDLDDDVLLCVLRQLLPHDRAMPRLAYHHLNALVGP